VACYYARQVALADPETRQALIEKSSTFGPEVVQPLVTRLKSVDAKVQANISTALLHWAGRNNSLCHHKLTVAQALSLSFANLGSTGQASALDIAWQLLQKERSVELLQASSALLEGAAHTSDAHVHREALRLADELLREPNRIALNPARSLILPCLHDDDAAIRNQAIELACHREVQLLQPVAELLHDHSPLVRRAAMAAVGAAPRAIATDDLLRWLHDPDEDVRALCAQALRSRGLSDEYLRLGRLLTDPEPSRRMLILESLGLHPELEPGAWLRRLSHDPSPAIRAAAIRRAADHPEINLADRLAQMGQDDSSPTVRQMAKYYMAKQAQSDQ
jgi:hypothetical protein